MCRSIFYPSQALLYADNTDTSHTGGSVPAKATTFTNTFQEDCFLVHDVILLFM